MKPKENAHRSEKITKKKKYCGGKDMERKGVVVKRKIVTTHPWEESALVAEKSNFSQI